MQRLISFVSLLLFACAGWSATLSVSSYFKDGFTPTAIAADPQGNIFVAGSTVVGAKAQTTSAIVAKVDSKIHQYLYLTYIDSAASDQIGGIAVDAAGNAYVAGSTTNPNFPVEGNSTLGTAPKNTTDSRPFVVKISPQGAILFAVLIGGSTSSTARGIAVTPQGQIIVSGIANATGFPTSAGAYTVADSTNHWYLTELDPTATKTIFSATGIGGSSLALDSTGNIYMAGSSVGTDYPTTPSALQTTFTQGYYCFGLCQIGFPGGLQHVTKVDPAATRLIYSTGLNATTSASGSTTNTGLAVDPAGNAYVTGQLVQAGFPFTATPPAGYSAFLAKLDPAGAKLLFSIPFGGGGVQLDASGTVYAAGNASSYVVIPIPGPNPPPGLPSVFSWLPAPCLANNVTSIGESYMIKVDPSTGAIQDGQWIDGSAITASAIALAGGQVWATGTAAAPDVPITPGVLEPFAPLALRPGYLQGGWLAAADFSAGPATGPMIGCVLDTGNLMHTGAVTGFQLISIFGAHLGPEPGVAAPDGMDPQVAGVSAVFDGNAQAQILYASSTQINLAVPLPLPTPQNVNWPTATVMQLNVNGATVTRQFPWIRNNLNLFAAPLAPLNCNGTSSGLAYQPIANNADGSLNSCANPAAAGSTVSFFMHGIGAVQLGFPPVSQISDLSATIGYCPALVTAANLTSDYVYKVDVQIPASLDVCYGFAIPSKLYALAVNFTYNGNPVGPFRVPGPGSLNINFDPGQPIQLTVFLKQ